MEEVSYQKTHSVQMAHWWYQARLDIIDQLIAGHLPAEADNSILEIGAGSGVNIGRLRRYGKVDAVEMHDGGRAMISKTFGDVETRGGALPDAEVFAGKTYDAVCMFDVLEHVEQHLEALQAIRAHVTPQGKLFITVPALQWLWSQHDVAMHHYRRYSRASLRDVLEQAGWNVETLGYFNTYLFPLALAARVKDLVFRPEISTGIDVPPKPVNAIFKSVFSSEASRVSKGGYPIGLSLMAVASPAHRSTGRLQ